MVKTFTTNLLNWLKTKVYMKSEVDTKLDGKSDSNHVHDTVTASSNGFMSMVDKSKLDSISEGATKNIVDDALSASSINPVQNKVVDTALKGKSDVNHTHVVDAELSSTSTNPVQNKVVNTALNSKANTNHTHKSLDIKADNTYQVQNQTGGYWKIMEIQIQSQYLDQPISFEVAPRQEKQITRCHLKFKSVNSTNPDIESFVKDQDLNTELYVARISDSKYGVYQKEVGTYSRISLHNITLSSNAQEYMTVTITRERVTSLPSGYVGCKVVCPSHTHDDYVSYTPATNVKFYSMNGWGLVSYTGLTTTTKDAWVTICTLPKNNRAGTVFYDTMNTGVDKVRARVNEQAILQIYIASTYTGSDNIYGQIMFPIS